MSLLSAAASDVVSVLIADSNRMQSQLLASALRRRPEFRITTCRMDTGSILQAVTSKAPRVALLSLNSSENPSEAVATLHRLHLSHPEIANLLLVESCNRELVVSAFRSGARGIFSINDANLRLLCKCILCVAGGQIWASTEQLNYLMDSISEVPSLVCSTPAATISSPRAKNRSSLSLPKA